MTKFSCKLSIDVPCPAKWADMQPVAAGNYCSICTKVVIDFTELSDDEILSIVAENKAQQICGKFKSSQLNRALEIQDAAAQNGFSARAKGLLASLFLMAIPAISSAADMHDVEIRDTSITPVETIDTMAQERIPDEDGYLIGAVRCFGCVHGDKPVGNEATRITKREARREKKLAKKNKPEN